MIGNFNITNNIQSLLQVAIKNIYKFSDFDAEEQAWDSVVAWLTRLRLLEGVPFSYIVSSEEMLPNESIRFFHMDRNWLDALVDGALSTGILDTRGPFASADDELKKELYEKLMNELNDRELIHNPLRASLTLHDKQKAKDSSAFDSIEMKAREKRSGGIYMEEDKIAPDLDYSLAMEEVVSCISTFDYSIGGQQTGFLLRSTVVRDYPGLEISAYDAPSLIGNNREQAYSEANRVETLRQVRLSDSIMLVIFNGLPTHLRIKEPGEGIRMGVDLQGGFTIDNAWNYMVKLKDVNGDLTSATQTIAARKGTGDVSVLHFSQIIDASPDGWDGHATPLEEGGFLATQLMQFPYQQDFQYDETDQTLPGKGTAKVNVNSILVDDDTVIDSNNTSDA